MLTRHSSGGYFRRAGAWPWGYHPSTGLLSSLEVSGDRIWDSVGGSPEHTQVKAKGTSDLITLNKPLLARTHGAMPRLVSPREEGGAAAGTARTASRRHGVTEPRPDRAWRLNVCDSGWASSVALPTPTHQTPTRHTPLRPPSPPPPSSPPPTQAQTSPSMTVGVATSREVWGEEEG